MRTSVPSVAHCPANQTSGRARWTTLIARLELMWQIHRERSMLQRLDDHMLKDLGLDRGQVETEAARSFFDVPGGRL